MVLTNILSTILSLSILLIGVLVIVRNQKKIENILFFTICLLSALWGYSFQSIEAVNSLDVSRILNSASYVLGVLLIFAVVSFTFVFPVRKNKKALFMYSYLLIPTAILSATTLIAGTVTLDQSTGEYLFSYGKLTFLYVIVMFLGVLLIGRNLLIGIKKFTPEQRSQSKFVATGFMISFIFGVGLSTLLPVLYPDTRLDDLSPFALIFLIAFSGTAILKHKLFDFRVILIRAFSYLVSTAFVITGYVTVAFLLKRFILPDSKVDTSQLIANILLTIVLVLAYPYVKRRFDKVSNKYFFRDSYDPQELIDRLNQTLVANVNLDELLTKSALIMQEEMKASFCTFYIRQTSYFDDRIIGTHRNTPEFDDIVGIDKYAAKIHRKVFSSESVSDIDYEIKLSQALKKNDIEVMARLTNMPDFEVKGIGYIFMGPKKSGSQYGTNDLKVLEIIANELVIAIENVLRFEEIEQFNFTLQKKIDDATKELKTTNDKLRALDEAKDEFVSMASHQLRTPLTSIKGYISMVLEGDAGKITESQKTMLGQAFFSSQRMVYLISDLLNVSRLKTGKFIIEKKPIYLPEVVESEIQQLVEGASAKNLTISFTKPKSFPTLLLDEMKLRQVIMNFTDNAIYYTPAGGKIVVELKETPKSVEFTVKDSGIGVPKEQQHKLFTKFYRADNARKARPDGTGLGLFMAKKVIIAQGGSMIFDSILGKGSTFGFSFPKDKLLATNTTKQ